MRGVIITGGTGFIGKNLAKYIREIYSPESKVFAPGSAELDLTDSLKTFKWFEETSVACEITHIFHLATLYKTGSWSQKYPATQLHVNMSMDLNVLEAWKRFCPQARLLNVLSYCMYPDHDNPHPESELFGTEPESFLYNYAFSKKALLVGQRAYCQEFGLSAIGVVLPTVYGPGDNLENPRVMASLVKKYINAVNANLREVEVWGDGMQEREFLYMDDAISGILSAADKGKSDALNIGVGQTDKLHNIARMISDAVGFKGKTVFNTDRFVGVSRRVMCVDKAKKEIEWSSQVEMSEGIKRTIESYRI
jgi:GDP-L-fucose synthase